MTTRAELEAEELRLRVEADNAAYLLLTTHADEPRRDDYAATHTALRAELESVRRRLAELANGPRLYAPSEASP